jgi:hypothetical protein
MATWIKFKHEYYGTDAILNLDEAIAFYIIGGQRIQVVIAGDIKFDFSQKKNSIAYQQILDYVKQTTGHSLL